MKLAKIQISWYSIFKIIGLNGISIHERRKIRHVGKIFEYLMLIAAVVLLVQWQLEIVGELKGFKDLLVTRLVWLFFVIEFLFLFGLVDDKKRYLRENWFLPTIIILGIPLILNLPHINQLAQNARLLLSIMIVFVSMRWIINFFIDGRLWTTILAGSIIVVIFGVVVAGVDPAIGSAWDGIWWAVATVSTVGYGDVVPSSALGRMIGGGLVIVGLGVFVVITANFLTLTLRKQVREIKREEYEVSEIFYEVRAIKELLEENLEQIKLLQQRIDNLEIKQ